MRPALVRQAGHRQGAERPCPVPALARKGAFTTVDTVAISNAHGYFDVHLAFPGSGTVRLAWTYPTGDPLLSGGTVFSRSVKITVK